jgi:hypothetical protein
MRSTENHREQTRRARRDRRPDATYDRDRRLAQRFVREAEIRQQLAHRGGLVSLMWSDARAWPNSQAVLAEFLAAGHSRIRRANVYFYDPEPAQHPVARQDIQTWGAGSGKVWPAASA